MRIISLVEFKRYCESHPEAMFRYSSIDDDDGFKEDSLSVVGVFNNVEVLFNPNIIYMRGDGCCLAFYGVRWLEKTEDTLSVVCFSTKNKTLLTRYLIRKI